MGIFLFCVGGGQGSGCFIQSFLNGCFFSVGCCQCRLSFIKRLLDFSNFRVSGEGRFSGFGESGFCCDFGGFGLSQFLLEDVFFPGRLEQFRGSIIQCFLQFGFCGCLRFLCRFQISDLLRQFFDFLVGGGQEGFGGLFGAYLSIGCFLLLFQLLRG